MPTIEYDEQCKNCRGTGLYAGVGELNGAAVVCHTCDGTGCHSVHVKYKPFTHRLDRIGITRVHKCNPGIGIDSSGQFGGMPIKEWESGLPFPEKSENRLYTCPAWWTQCSGDHKGVTDSDWCNQFAGHRFSDCIKFSEKETCWKLYDKLIKRGG